MTSHIPLRTCLCCRRKRPKSELARIARSADGRLVVDEKNRMPGRGAYVCLERNCVGNVGRGRRFQSRLKAGAHPELSARLEKILAQRESTAR